MPGDCVRLTPSESDAGSPVTTCINRGIGALGSIEASSTDHDLPEPVDVSLQPLETGFRLSWSNDATPKRSFSLDVTVETPQASGFLPDGEHEISQALGSVSEQFQIGAAKGWSQIHDWRSDVAGDVTLGTVTVKGSKGRMAYRDLSVTIPAAGNKTSGALTVSVPLLEVFGSAATILSREGRVPVPCEFPREEACACISEKNALNLPTQLGESRRRVNLDAADENGVTDEDGDLDANLATFRICVDPSGDIDGVS